MRLVRLLPARWQKFIHEALKFGAVGGINTVVNYAVFNALALTVLANGQLKATVIATIVSATTSYLMNRHWTYGDRPRSALRREYLLFFFFNAAGLAIELAVLGAAKYGLGLTSLLALNVAKTVGLVLGTVFRFWSYRTFVFQPAAQPAGAALAPSAAPSAKAAPIAAALDPAAALAAESTDAADDDQALDLADLDRELAFEVELDEVDRSAARR
ncbi:MAG TPA: GtrA family protein [Micromonosporaceae bacterium]|nr:GtrA family protein [Micromonosporaceae bacterium]